MTLPTDLNDRWHRSFRQDPHNENQGLVAVLNIDGNLPTEGNNSSLVLGYTGSNLTTITKTIGSTSYVKTLTYTGDVLTGVSVWAEA